MKEYNKSTKNSNYVVQGFGSISVIPLLTTDGHAILISLYGLLELSLAIILVRKEKRVW